MRPADVKDWNVRFAFRFICIEFWILDYWQQSISLLVFIYPYLVYYIIGRKLNLLS